ncbi:EAL domain-containing protein [Neiella sp. HB171785]|uniref:EAL domain-containing protein n=1 Tax=Neiella litorisoli TaxID=2771431 RepID=A0A8J6UGN0_9GAMM|nr:EAL domain-containing protein [Neiella litorisoli]
MYTQSCHIESIDHLNQWLTATAAQAPVNPSAILVQLYAYEYTSNVEQYANTIAQHLPDALITGASSQQGLVNADAEIHSITVIVSWFETTQLAASWQPMTDDLYEAGQQIASNIVNQDTKVLLILVDNFSFNSELFWQGMQTLEHDIVIAGGQAVPIPSGSWLLLNGVIHHRAAIAISLSSPELSAVNYGLSDWFPIGRAHRVGFSAGNRVYKIGGRTAYDQYCRYLNNGQKVSLEAISDFPLMVGDQREYTILTPIRIHHDGSIEFDHGLTEGEEVWFVYSHPSLTAQHKQDSLQQLEKFQPQSIYIYNCWSRANLAHQPGHNELEPFAELAQTAGFYCYGEFSGVQQPQSLHHTLTYLALSEDPASKQPDVPRHDAHNSLSHLFHIIRRSLADLETMTEDLATEVANKNQQLLQSLKVDSLTGLPNYMALQEACDTSVHITHAVAIRLNNLAAINEFYGHHIGDVALRHVAKKIQIWACELEANCQVYYTGPSEWVLTLQRVSGDMTPYLGHTLEQFIEELEAQPIDLTGHLNGAFLNVVLTAGIADYSDLANENCRANQLVLKAHEARRRARQKNSLVCSANELSGTTSQVQNHINALYQVNTALAEQRVFLFGHPIFSAGDRQQVSTECLVRIHQHEQFILPSEFLVPIQDTHVYSRLSRHIIDQALTLMDGGDKRYSINLAPQDLQNDHTMQLLLNRISRLKTPHLLGIEIVETEEIEDYLHLKNICSAIRRHGARLIIDDFGSGYSNIDEILALSPDVIKFDGSLIRHIDRNERQRLIVSNMVKLFTDMKIETVAEFVHSATVCEIVEDLGVDYLQGFYLAEPALLSAVTEPIQLQR